MKNFLLVVRTAIVAVLFLPSLLFAQSNVKDLEFFVDDEIHAPIIEAKMESDWKLLRKGKAKPKYQPAQMTFYLNGGDSVVLNAKLKARGLFRRNFCLFPPVWVNFKGSDFSNSSVKEFDKIKLVTHCRDQTPYKQQLFQEYYIYKAYEMVTDYSFRTRLLKLNYVDSAAKKDIGENYGFLIETVEQLAGRLNSTVLPSTSQLHPQRLNLELATIMDVFQFMIGNTDWSVTAQHNVKILKSKDPTNYSPVAIAYDFDYCGLINASYAVPPEELGIESVAERKYRGFCRTEEEFQKVFDLFTEHKDEMIALFQDSELLDKQYKTEAVKYMEESLEIIGNPNLAKRFIIQDCRTNK